MMIMLQLYMNHSSSYFKRPSNAADELTDLITCKSKSVPGESDSSALWLLLARISATLPSKSTKHELLMCGNKRHHTQLTKYISDWYPHHQQQRSNIIGVKIKLRIQVSLIYLTYLRRITRLVAIV